ncbi:uroplakin-2 [Pyxicephalus adspersus]|uniref:uroplakin-2 n=1 Tax=Pyxicephalus adspersus TaxID=30357 RepID=UPI003B5948FE
MQLLGLSVLLLIISTSYGQDNVTVLASGLTANPLSTSVVIQFPNACKYTSKNATLYISQGNLISNFNLTVPQCRPKRDLVVISNSQSGNTETVNVGYQVQNLTPNTTYKAYYTIDSEKFTEVSFTTKNGLSSAPLDVFARSGGMVVITVLLSIAMFLLIVGLIVVIVLGGRGKK